MDFFYDFLVLIQNREQLLFRVYKLLFPRTGTSTVSLCLSNYFAPTGQTDGFCKLLHLNGLKCQAKAPVKHLPGKPFVCDVEEVLKVILCRVLEFLLKV